MVGILSAGLIVSIGSAVYKSEYDAFLLSHDTERFLRGAGPIILVIIIGIGFLYWLLGFLNSRVNKEKLMFVRLIEEREQNKKKITDNRLQKLKKNMKIKLKKLPYSGIIPFK